MDIFELKSFSEVWDRVESCAEREPASPTPTPEPRQAETRGDADILRGFIADETADASCYAAMAARCPRDGGIFRRLSAEEACHARRLRAAYFIRTGENACQCAVPPRITAVSDALRKRYAEETAGAAAYADAAETTKDAELTSLYSELSGDETRHAREIGGLIERMLR